MFEQAEVAALARSAQKVGRLYTAIQLLGWDQETMMPKGGAASRAGVVGELTEVAHRLATSNEYRETLERAEEVASDEVSRALCREVRRSYDRSCKVPAELAEEIARTASESQAVWSEAKQKNDFARFQPYLEKLVALQSRKAEAVGGGADLYAVMLDEYEPGCTVEDVRSYVDQVRPTLDKLLADFGPRAAEAKALIPSGGYDVGAQERFGMEVLRDMGFDFYHGRVDTSAHPFCSGIHPDDVRLTTRYRPDDLESLFSLVHEGGHGLYEQGLPLEWDQTPLGGAVSLGIHESQSRLWENIVARGHAFWRHYLPKLSAAYPGKLRGMDVDTFLRGINRVEPSLTRVDADEVTYNYHIFLRFELEQELIGQSVRVSDLPGIWNEKMTEYLGVTPATDGEGVLQDVHWSFGAFGYFPTYFLGNLYASQFYGVAAQELGDLDDQIARGEMRPLREWLREKVHSKASLLPAGELCESVTGEPLDAKYFSEYLDGKLRGIYA